MRIVDKPWGREEILENNGRYVLKRLFMNHGHQCSLQYHEKKHETLIVISGSLLVSFGLSVDELEHISLEPGDHLALPENTIHRCMARGDTVYLEASTAELDDVVRLADNYGRGTNK